MRLRMSGFMLIALFLAGFAVSAHASRDIVQFGSNIEVGPEASVHDTVCFFCSVNNRGTVEGDIVVFFGNVRIDGHANHDVVNFFGSVNVADNSTVGKDLVSMFGSVRLGDNVSVGKDLVAIFGGIRAPENVIVGGNRVVQPGWVFWGPFLIFAVVLILIVREIRSHRRRAYLRGVPYPPRR